MLLCFYPGLCIALQEQVDSPVPAGKTNRRWLLQRGIILASQQRRDGEVLTKLSVNLSITYSGMMLITHCHKLMISIILLHIYRHGIVFILSRFDFSYMDGNSECLKTTFCWESAPYFSCIIDPVTCYHIIYNEIFPLLHLPISHYANPGVANGCVIYVSSSPWHSQIRRTCKNVCIAESNSTLNTADYGSFSN